uniref:BOS complex subunit TMEM147 n=1 Tax=Syphacia muris TaxID=451379 RepID=A0A0N5AJH1_9BILA
MTFFHFVNCLALAYGPYFIGYRYSGLSEYSSIWKCAQASIAYFITQLGKMLILATFFPASDSENFEVFPELLKNGADLFDLIGLHIVIAYLVAGKSEVRFMTAGLGWAFAHSVATRFLSFWVGARGTAFHWKFIQMAFESNIDLIFYIALAALVWSISRKDLQPMMKRLVVVLLIFCAFHSFLYQ